MIAACRKLVEKMRRHPRVALGLLVSLATALGVGGYVGGRQLWAWQHYREAERALQKRPVPDLAEARQHLDACLVVWPNSAATHLLAARTARRTNSLDVAERHLEACERLGGVTEATKLERTLLHAQRGGLADVEETLRSHLDGKHPDSLFILEVLTTELKKADRLDETRRYLDLWLERSPDDYEGLIRRAWVEGEVQDHPAAVRDYRRALEMAPGQDQVRLALAEMLVATGQAREALPHFERLRAGKPDDPAMLFGLARCRRQLGQLDEARQLLDALLTARPEDHQALTERGQLLLETGHPEAAEGDLRQAVAQDPHDHRLLYSLFQCLERVGKQSEAREYAAQVKRIRADMDRVDELTERIRRSSPHDPSLRHEVGTLLLRNGFYRNGLQWLGTALQEDPEHRPTHQALAEFYERTGKPDLAAHHRRFLQPSE